MLFPLNIIIQGNVKYACLSKLLSNELLTCSESSLSCLLSWKQEAKFSMSKNVHIIKKMDPEILWRSEHITKYSMFCCMRC